MAPDDNVTPCRHQIVPLPCMQRPRPVWHLLILGWTVWGVRLVVNKSVLFVCAEAKHLWAASSIVTPCRHHIAVMPCEKRWLQKLAISSSFQVT